MKLEGEKLRAKRFEESQPVVNAIYAWCQEKLKKNLLPDHPLIKAVNYPLTLETALRVFLKNPDVRLDTNHLERQIRVIPVEKRTDSSHGQN